VPDASSGKIGGVSATASAFSFDGSVYVSIEFNPATTGSRSEQKPVVVVPVTARIDFFGNDRKVIHTSVIEGIFAGKQEFLRTTFENYDIMEIEVLLSVGEGSLTLKAKVIHK
jgi:hypothetical protein